MDIRYNVTLKNQIKNSSISYWADSFSVDENRILRIKSRECGDITVRINNDERLVVCDVFIKDEFDDIENI